MKTFLTLVKTSLNVNFGISALKYRFTREKGKAWKTLGIGLLAVFGFGSLIAAYVFMLVQLYFGLTMINQHRLIITMTFMAAQLIVLFFGMFYLMSAFYFSKDINILIPLPLKPSHILGSKFITVMFNEYLTLIPVFLPALIIYGVGMKQGIYYWAKGIILMLTAPVIPLAIGSVLIVLLMRVVNFRKSKDLLAIVGGFLSIFFAVGINIFAQRLSQDSSPEALKSLLESQIGLINTVGSKFPPSIWATLGLTESGLESARYMLLFLAVSCIMLALLLWLSDKLFIKSVISGQETNRKKKLLSSEDIEKKYTKATGATLTIFWREWKLLFRTPIYVLNGMAGVVMVPIMATVMFFTGQGELSQLAETVRSQGQEGYISIGVLAFMLFTSGMNIVASTAVSREGSTFWISKLIPVPAKQQVAAKLLHGIVVGAMGVIVTAAVVLIILKLSIIKAVILILLGILGTVVNTALSLIVDVLKPKLEWTNAQEAVKQNLNGFIGILIGLFVILVICGGGLVAVAIGLNEWVAYLIIAALCTVLIIPVLLGLFAAAEWSYKRIEIH